MHIGSLTAALRTRRWFAAQHRWDRNFFLALVLLVWAGMVAGFGLDLVQRFQGSTRAYPWIVYLYEIASIGWLVLLTAQLLAVRRDRQSLHARLGKLGFDLVPVLVILGVASTIAVRRMTLGQPDDDPQFISANLTELLGFGALAAAGHLSRGEPAAHKRLMLLATIYLATDASRCLWQFTIGLDLSSFWSHFLFLNAAGDLLIVALGVYDLATRGRLHPAYMAGASWILASQTVASWLYFQPWWKPVAIALLWD